MSRKAQGQNYEIYFQGWNPNLALDNDDIRAIQSLYGAKNGNSGGRSRSEVVLKAFGTNNRNNWKNRNKKVPRTRSRVYGSGPFG